MKATVSPAKAEKVNQILIRSNFQDLSPETLLASFHAEGVRSLEDLATRFSAQLRDPEGLPQPINYEELFAEPTPPEVLAGIKHQVPEMPFIMDGVEHDPADIVRYNGQELGFIPKQGSAELLVLRDKNVWAPFLRAALLARACGIALTDHGYLPEQLGHAFPPAVSNHLRGGGPEGPVYPPPPPFQSYWTDINFSGNGLWLDPGESRRNLLKVSTGLFGGDFNDKISSFMGTSSLCMAFEHIGFTGSFLWTGPNDSGDANLHAFGWGDRISSLINGG